MARPTKASCRNSALDDEQVANVLTYVYNQWGNNGTEIVPDMVKEVRAQAPPPTGIAPQ